MNIYSITINLEPNKDLVRYEIGLHGGESFLEYLESPRIIECFDNCINKEDVIYYLVGILSREDEKINQIEWVIERDKNMIEMSKLSVYFLKKADPTFKKDFIKQSKKKSTFIERSKEFKKHLTDNYSNASLTEPQISTIRDEFLLKLRKDIFSEDDREADDIYYEARFKVQDDTSIVKPKTFTLFPFFKFKRHLEPFLVI